MQMYDAVFNREPVELSIQQSQPIELDVGNRVIVKKEPNPDYNALDNIPTINGVLVAGDKTPEDYGLQRKLTEIGAADLLKMWDEII